MFFIQNLFQKVLTNLFTGRVNESVLLVIIDNNKKVKSLKHCWCEKSSKENLISGKIDRLRWKPALKFDNSSEIIEDFYTRYANKP